MAFVDVFGHTPDPIQQCFNSQRSPGQATSGDCGFTWSQPGTSDQIINFGFQVSDRIVSVTPAGNAYETVSSPNGNSFQVKGVNGNGGTCACPFYIVVY